jgi:O-antigen/teichoic acid export membrane protein
MSKRKYKIISGIGIDTAGTIISMVVGLLVVPFFFHYISKEQYGLWLAIYGLVALISVVDMGTDQYLTTIISDDKKFFSLEIGHHLLSTLIVKLAVVSVFAVVGIILYIFITSLLVIVPSSLEAAKNTYLIALLALFFTLFSGTVSTILYGRHHYSLVNGLASLSGILASFGTILFLAFGYNIRAFPLALLCAALIQFAILFGFLVKNYPHVRLTLTDFQFQNKKEMIGYSVSFQILRWVHTLRTQYIVIAINNLVGPSAAALYNLTNRLPQMGTVFSSKIALPFFPTFSEYFANEKIELAAVAFTKVNRLLFRFALFAAIVCFVVTKPFVSLWVGLNSFAGIGVLFLLCFYAFVLAAMGAFGIVIYASKNFEKWTFVSVIEIICAITLSYVLSFDLGLFGVIAGFALASIISQFYLFKIVLKQLQLPFVEFAKNVFIYTLVTNASTLLVALLITSFVEISGWIELISVCMTFALIHVLSHEGVLMLKSKEIGLKAKFISTVKL